MIGGRKAGRAGGDDSCADDDGGCVNLSIGRTAVNLLQLDILKTKGDTYTEVVTTSDVVNAGGVYGPGA